MGFPQGPCSAYTMGCSGEAGGEELVNMEEGDRESTGQNIVSITSKAPPGMCGILPWLLLPFRRKSKIHHP